MEMKTKKEVGGNWEMVKIPEVLFFQEGPGVRNTQFTTSGVKLLNVGNINFGNLNLDATKIHISEVEAYGKYSHFLVEEGDLLIASSGIVVDNFHNKITWAKKEHLPLCLNTSTIRFRSLDSQVLDIGFFSYFLKTRIFADQLSRLITGSAQLNFGPSHIKQISLPLPPLATQQRIAAILDAADALRRKDQELLRKYDELAQAIFIDMFGDPVKNEKGWEVKKLGEVTNQITKGESPNWQGFKYENEGILFITSENVLWGSLNLKENTTKYISNNFHQKLKRSQLMLNDVLINLVGASIGRCAVVTNDYLPSNINQAVASIRVDSKTLNSTFLLHQIINDELQKLVTGNIVDAARANISLGNLRDLSIIIPPLDIQNKFTTCLGHLSLIKKNTLYKESETLFHSLLQQAFNGELV